MVTLTQALARQFPCFGDCHATLSREQRTRAIDAIYHCDDALRGWGYEPLYDIDGDRLWRDAQAAGDATYRGVAVRFGECIYRRLLGGMLHECLHALFGDPSRANYGIPFGLPYGVPVDVPERDEEAYLAPHNFAEACAFVGVSVLGAKFGIDWPALNAREYGTFCFKGGNALVQVPRGYRAVAHLDPVHHEHRYLRRARAIEEDARKHLADGNVLADLVARLDAAAARGKATRREVYRSSSEVADIKPTRVGANDPCLCGSGEKAKRCHGTAHTVALTARASR